MEVLPLRRKRNINQPCHDIHKSVSFLLISSVGISIRALQYCACYQACDIFVHHIGGSHYKHLFILLFWLHWPPPPTYLAYINRILQLQHLLVEAHQKMWSGVVRFARWDLSQKTCAFRWDGALARYPPSALLNLPGNPRGSHGSHP